MVKVRESSAGMNVVRGTSIMNKTTMGGKAWKERKEVPNPGNCYIWLWGNGDIKDSYRV